ncbi:MAG: PqqD family protein [Aestuariivirgaceae bacterium]|nr:PqqD family protein [Aestuariivirgaceae bacterium]
MAGLVGWTALQTDADTLCLHAAAARIGNKTILFVAPFGTGKSSLIASLAAKGAEIMSDDALLFDAPTLSIQGMNLALRLRRRFIDFASVPLQHWVEANRLYAGRRYVFLKPREVSAARFSVTDVMLLNRQPDPVAVSAVEVPTSRILPRLIWHNLSRHHAPSRISMLATRLAAGVRCSSLNFSDAEMAAEFLLSGDFTLGKHVDGALLESFSSANIQLTRTDNGAIVSNDDNGQIFEINETAFVIWTLIGKFGGRDEILNALEVIYEGTPQVELGLELDRCVNLFCGNGFIPHGRGAELLEIGA